MSQENVELIRAGFEGFNRGDISYVLTVMAEDCEWRPPSYAVDGESFVGPGGYVRWYERFKETWSSVRITAAIRDAGERHAVAEVRLENVGRGSGAPVNQVFWIAYTIDDGKFTRIESYVSEAEALEAVGLRE